MEIEMHLRITLDHLAEELDDLQWIHHSQGVGQHEAFDPSLGGAEGGYCIHQLIDIVRRILHAIGPVLQIEINAKTLAGSIDQFTQDIIDMLIGGFL